MRRKLFKVLVAMMISVTALFALGMTAAAENVGDFEVTGGANGTDYTYEEGVLTIKTATPLTIKNTDSSTPTADRILVAKDISANITLAGVNIDGSLSDDDDDKSAFRIESYSTGNVTITLADGTTNMLKSGGGDAGLNKSGDGDDIGRLTIQGGPLGTGSLFATGGDEAAGIGSGFEMACSNITISGGNITATGGDGGAGIGGGLKGAVSKITISGGTVTAKGIYGGAGIGGSYRNGSDITISGGTVIAIGGTMGGAAIGGGDSSEGSNITIKNSIVYVTAGSGADPIGDGANSSNSLTDTPSLTDAIIVDNTAQTVTVYGNVTLTENFKVPEGYTMTIPENSTVTVAEGTIFTNNGTVTNNGTINNKGTVANGGTIDNKGKITGNDVAGGVNTYDFVITGGTEGVDYTYRGGVLTVLTDTPITIANIDTNTATTDRIEVEADKDANITLAGVNIDVSLLSPTAAFKIADNSTGNVTITLADGRTNTLKSGTGCAGLQKNGAFISETEGKLTIQGGELGTGILNATGGENSAGIGGGQGWAGSDITISGGTVTATGGENSAGIGGGYEGAGSDITISGGKVNATGGDGGAGIGGGYKGAGSDITINDGTVIATGGDSGAGIGGGMNGDGSNINISDGTVTATGGENSAGIGGGAGSDITISGGTVTATGGYHAPGIGGDNGIAKDGEGSVGSDITISGGNVTAKGGDGGAGIGNGYEDAASVIIISGGKVNATGGDGGAGIGGGSYSEGSDITISGGSVKAVAGTDANAIGGGYGKDAVTPTDGNGNNVYLLEIENADNDDIKINGTDYPDKHFDEAKIYAYLPAKTAQIPNEVTVGTEMTEYCYDTANSKWLKVVDAPVEDTTDFTYNGEEQTYALTESDCYTISGNKQTNAGTYTVTVALNDGYIWSDGTSNDAEYEFIIQKATPTADMFTYTAPTSLDYDGQQKIATVTTDKVGMGEITVKYSDTPINVGTYTVYIDVADGENYNATSDLEVGTFTINGIDPTPNPSPKPTPTPNPSPVVTVNNEPQIKDENGKTGWNAIKNELEKADDGDTVVVDMNGTTKLPKDITSEIKGRDITLVLEMDGGIIWTINGLDVTNPKTVDMRVIKGANRIPVDVINNVTGESYTVQLSLAHNGDFGFTAVLTVDLGKKNNGLIANLFWYNEKTDELEHVDFDEIQSGKAELMFTHASEWAVVIDEEVLGEYDDVSSAAGITDNAEILPDSNAPIAVAAISFAGLALAAVIAKKRKAE